MHFQWSFALLSLASIALGSPIIHFPIKRRSGAFPTGDIADFEFLAEQISLAESRFNLTHREIEGNKIVRKAKPLPHGTADEGGRLLGEVGKDGAWYAELKVGEPEQTVQLDLDTLTSDFLFYSTTSERGTPFIDFGSDTYLKGNEWPTPHCMLPSDSIWFPTINQTLPIKFAHCRPARASPLTLGPSGSILGLAPSESLSQTKTPSLLKQLVERKIIEQSVWSFMLISGEEGIFSIGGTGAETVVLAENQIQEQLRAAGEREKQDSPAETPVPLIRRELKGSAVVPLDPTAWEKDWRWSKVQGADGWWQILMQGVWVDNVKILKNQPIVIDFNVPFILAPPYAAKLFYSSVSGSRQLSPPYDQFHVFPCLNPPLLAFEFDRWQFPVMRGGNGAEFWTGPGGKLSLGRLKKGSGYCVGAIVETRMGVSDTGVAMRGKVGAGSVSGEEGLQAGNGLRDVWVMGELFWRGVGGVFDFKDGRVGLRSY